jgi:two-component system chemotaxis response regulator CheB
VNDPLLVESAAEADFVIAVGTSAGGLRALRCVLSRLPRDFPAPIVIVLHMAPRHQSNLAEILQRDCVLPIKQAEAGDPLAPGHVYVAPPDYHLLVDSSRKLSLSHAKMIHFTRPSADALFESLAAACGGRAIAVVLTGSGEDGAAGIVAVKRMGGRVISQDEETSEHFGMPGAAAKTGAVDFVLPLDKIAETLGRLVTAEHPRGARHE